MTDRGKRARAALPPALLTHVPKRTFAPLLVGALLSSRLTRSLIVVDGECGGTAT